MRRIPKRIVTSGPDKASLASFDLNLLRVFDALLAARSVSGAAARLGLSQPATSAALSRLRKSLDDPVLIRSGNQMIATPLAVGLSPQVARILENIGDTLRKTTTFDPATSLRRFRVGANDYTTLVLLAPLARRLQQIAPRVTLEIMPLDKAPDAGLANRELDLIVSDRWYVRGARNLETLLQESFVSVARADHPRLSRVPTLEEFVREEHALISALGVVPGVVDHALAALGRSRRIALTMPHYLVAPLVVSHTDLIITMPSRIARLCVASYSLRQFAPPVAIEGFDVVMAFHPRNRVEPAVQWLMQALRSVAAEFDQTVLRMPNSQSNKSRSRRHMSGGK
jgi:DNA-binding transcriptional LysR family regulator